MDRRTFIRKSSTAAFASLFIGKSLFANQSANSRINIGVVGLGKQAMHHLRFIRSDSRCWLAALCDIDSERLQYNKKDTDNYYASKGVTSDVKTYSDFRDLLADKSIDAVFIVTPDHWHAIMCIMAARAGKHIYCEKPLTFTVQEGALVAEAVKASGVVFQTGSQQRSERSFRNLVQLARSGALGEIKEVFCNFSWHFPKVHNWKAESVPDNINWNMWIGPSPMRPYSQRLLSALYYGEKKVLYGAPWGEWRFHSDFGNGMQADWGAHHYDIAQWGLNMDGKGPKYVQLSKRKYPEFSTYSEKLIYTYENGVKVITGTSDDAKKAGCAANAMVTFVGKKAMAAASRADYFWASKPSLYDPKIFANVDNAYVSTEHRANFIEGILTGRPVICPVQVGQSSCNMCLIGNIAHKLDRDLEWDYKTLSFKNDATANAMLARKDRQSWQSGKSLA